MEPRVNKILKKLSNEKIKLATKNVELTEEVFNKVTNHFEYIA